MSQVLDTELGVGELTGLVQGDVRLVELRPQPPDPGLPAEGRVLVLEQHRITVHARLQAQRRAVQDR